MKRGPQQRDDKHLSKKGLIKTIQEVFQKIKLVPSKTKKTKTPILITIADCLMSAVAMFSLKAPSLLGFDQMKRDKNVDHNLKTLFGIGRAPCDTYMREILDMIDPQSIRGAFKAIFTKLQRGNFLKQYEFLGGLLMAVDGTGIFDSEKISCENCCIKKHRDGRINYYHQILTGVIVCPGVSQVIPFFPEQIRKQDGATKNDCENNATKRFLKDLKREHPRLKITLTFDNLFANAPCINELISHGYDYIIVAKPSGNIKLFEFLNGVDFNTTTIIDQKNTYHFRYINHVPLNNSKNAPSVNYFEVEAIEINGRKTETHHFSFVTGHKINNDNIYTLLRGGRAKWKIENETFNTLKNQGYQLEHNFGHGEKYLYSVFAALMMLSFLIDQVQEASDGLFQAALKKMKSRRRLWERVRSIFDLCTVESWEALYQAIAEESISIALTNDSS